MTPQLTVLLKHLKEQKTISQAEAGLIYKIRALPKRISELKELGYTITREIKKDPTGQRYARYTLEDVLKDTEPRKDAPIKALNVRPTIGDRVVVVRPTLSFGNYTRDSVGKVVDIYRGNPQHLEVIFDHLETDETVLVFNDEVEVIAHE